MGTMLSVRKITVLAVLCLLMSLSAFAREKNSGPLTLSDPAQIGTTELKPGDYKVEWDGKGPDVQVRIMQGRQALATTTAKLVQHEKSAAQNDVVLKQTARNSKTIEEIDFRNRKEALVLNPKVTGN